jgi:hypothetical protein
MVCGLILLCSADHTTHEGNEASPSKTPAARRPYQQKVQNTH